MTFISSLRRSLRILMVVTSLAVGLAPAAVAAGARLPALVAHRTVRPAAGSRDATLAQLWQRLHGLWEALGSSMDPLGNH